MLPIFVKYLGYRSLRPTSPRLKAIGLYDYFLQKKRKDGNLTNQRGRIGSYAKIKIIGEFLIKGLRSVEGFLRSQLTTPQLTSEGLRTFKATRSYEFNSISTRHRFA